MYISLYIPIWLCCQVSARVRGLAPFFLALFAEVARLDEILWKTCDRVMGFRNLGFREGSGLWGRPLGGSEAAGSRP